MYMSSAFRSGYKKCLSTSVDMPRIDKKDDYNSEEFFMGALNKVADEYNWTVTQKVTETFINFKLSIPVPEVVILALREKSAEDEELGPTVLQLCSLRESVN